MQDHVPGFVLAADEGESFWQPVPANGYVINKLWPANWDAPFSLGCQVVAPQSYIRRHVHDRHKEVLFVWGGAGRAVLDGVEHTLAPGSIIALPAGVEHLIANDGDADLRLLWILAPHGLEDFFRQIGRPRAPGEPPPAPFPRPANVLQIEAATVFKPGSTTVP